MTFSQNPTLRLILPLAAFVVFAMLLTFSLIRMFEIEKDMRVDAEQNMLWVLHQSEVAALRLSETVALADLGEATRDDLSLRFDLLVSRFALLNGGPQRRFLEHTGFSDDLDHLSGTLASIAPMIAEFAPGDGAPLRVELAPFPRLVGRAANAAMIAEWDELGGRLETYRDQLRQIIASLIGIMMAGGILAVILVLALRQTRQRNRMLRRERDFSALLVSSSGEGILAVDQSTRCTMWNSAMTQLLETSGEDAVNQPLDRIAGFFDTTPVREGIKSALQGETSRHMLQPLFRKDADEPLYVDLRFFPMRNEEDILGAILFINDASDRYAVHQKDAQDRDRLEYLVAERTSELDDALLRERSAGEIYRNFAAMISHQFRTPLAVADSALQRLIRRGPHAKPDEVVERAGRARNAIAGLTRLVESTLDAARLDAGQMGARRVECDLGEIIRTVCARQRETTPTSKIDLRFGVSGSVAAFCDPAHAEHILENLLSNGIKYAAPETSVSVVLHADAQWLFCDVSNSGHTIPENERTQIFDRNYRGTNSVGVVGTGIGLFMARALARLQGGDVTLQPDVAGVTFRMTLLRFKKGQT